MTDNKTPIDQALDVLVYAPLGLALSVRDLLPQLAEKGRERVQGQVSSARMVGQFAVSMGQKEAAKAVRNARGQRTSPPAAPARPAPAPPPAATAPTAAPKPAPRPPSTAVTPGPSHPQTSGPIAGTPVTRPREEPAPANGQSRSTPPAPGGTSAAGDPASLAIPGYDTLSASQVVQRLPGLSALELAAVGVYERTNRARKTILSRVAQLQGGNGVG